MILDNEATISFFEEKKQLEESDSNRIMALCQIS